MSLSRRSLLQGGLVLGLGLSVPRALAGTAGPALITARPSLRPGGPPRVGPYRVLAGSLHDHTTDSDGDSSSEVVAKFLSDYREDLGLDYASVTDHSDFFPLAYQREVNAAQALNPTAPVPDLWHRQGALAATYHSEDFSLVRGFEWTNDQQNHLNVLLSENWTSRAVTGDGSLRMDPFWTWLAHDPITDPTGTGLGFGGGDGIGIFNHPGDKGALNWDDYGLNAGAAQRMSLIEIHGTYGRDGRLDSDAGWYWFALSKGWHVSPVMNWDWHEWTTNQGVLNNPQPGASYDEGRHFLPGQRSLVLATSSLQRDLKEALSARRTSATEIPDLWASLRGPKGVWQGGLIEGVPGETLELRVDAGSATEPLLGVEIIGDNGLTGHDHYYGDNPDWNANHSQLTGSYVEQHRRYVVNGDATRKRRPNGSRHDGPPAGTVMASASLSGSRDHTTVQVTVPTTPSPRPDGRHFFYAIVYAGKPAFPARAWTGPLLTTPYTGHGQDVG